MEVPELQLANLRGGESREKPQEIKGNVTCSRTCLTDDPGFLTVTDVKEKP